MVHLQDIHFGYGGRALMEGVSLHVKPRDRVALVGPNGAGKTTLLRIITGEVGGYEGIVSRRKGIEIGLLPQDGIYDSGRTVLDSAMEAFSPMIALKRELEKLNSEVESETDDARRGQLLARLGDCQNKFEAGGGFTYKADTAKVLTGLGFGEADFTRDVSTFSGGWQMRIALARLLLKKPGVLLLDEPTNHLDLPAIIWFESFLHSYDGAVVFISHDRGFLDRVARRIAEFSQRKLEFYAGNYSHYEVEKEKRLELLRNRMENQQREIRETERFIERFRYKATKARQVQSRVKALEKIDRIEMPRGRKELRFSFSPGRKSGKSVMQLSGVSKAYGDNRVLENVNLSVSRGDRIGVIGANGLGKSTLMRVLAGRTDFTGERKPGHNVSIGYFSQDQYELLSADSTVLEEAAKSTGPGFGGNLRSLLGVFLFSGRDVDKKVGVLSGGEKSRLLLARLMADPANFLLLDEPTNHLDPPSRKMLEGVLSGYDGTLCFVSHDRYFINAVANRVVEVTAGRIEQYLGDYDDYAAAKKEREKLRDETVTPEKDEHPKKTAADRKAGRQERAKFVAERSRALTPIKTALAEQEVLIHKLEARAEEIKTLLADPATYEYSEKARALPAELGEVGAALEAALAKWESLSEELAVREKEFEEKG